MKKIGVCVSLLFCQMAFAAHTIPLNIKDQGRVFQGDLYFPNTPVNHPLPLVVVVHEWWGKTEYPERRGKEIADGLGYAALVVDLYGGGKKTELASEAKDLAAPFYQNPNLGVNRIESFIQAATDAASRDKRPIDVTKIAAIGYCFGGTQVLNLARSGTLPNSEKLLGVVSFHGGLASSLKAKAPFQSKVLVLHGAADQFVKPEEVEAFKTEMKKAEADLKFISYPDATHAFSNPKATELAHKNKIPVAYNKQADVKSWSEMVKFLKNIFK